MRRALEIARIVAFVAFLVAPVAALGVFGVPPPYGFGYTDFPPLEKVIGHAPAARKNLGDAVLQRSVLKREAISLIHRFAYHVLHYLDTPQIVSGRDGWLFFKAQFYGGKCLDRPTATLALGHLDTMTEMAAVSGVRLVFAVAPDKSIIYPKKLHSRARGYWGCKAKSGKLWRRIARKEIPTLVDLSTAILSAKKDYPSGSFYYPTDTHWTRLGAALGRRQLMTALAGRDLALPAPVVLPAPQPSETDLSRLSLLDLPLQPGPDLDPAVEAAIATKGDALDLGTLAVVHDSFVGVWEDDFAAALPGTYHWLSDPKRTTDDAKIAEADTIIAVVVERAIVLQALRGFLTWHDPLGSAILARNARAAAACSFGPALGNLVVVPPPGPKHPATLPVGIPVTEGHLSCITIAIESASPVSLKITLPPKRKKSAAFPRSIEIPVEAGAQAVRLVLPARAMGKTVTISLADKAPIDLVKSVSLGTLAAPP